MYMNNDLRAEKRVGGEAGRLSSPFLVGLVGEWTVELRLFGKVGDIGLVTSRGGAD
jgi:hypothetical protein